MNVLTWLNLLLKLVRLVTCDMDISLYCGQLGSFDNFLNSWKGISIMWNKPGKLDLNYLKHALYVRFSSL